MSQMAFGQSKDERTKLFLVTKLNSLENTANTTVRIPMDILIYFTKFTNPGNLENQCLLDLYVQTAAALPNPLASGLM